MYKHNMNMIGIILKVAEALGSFVWGKATYVVKLAFETNSWLVICLSSSNRKKLSTIKVEFA